MTESSQGSIKKAIQAEIIHLMEGVMDRVLRTDPFIPEEHHARRPLYAALVPDEVFKGSHFERRFVTPFGLAWEKLGLVVARAGLGYAERGYRINGLVNTERLRRITEILNNLEHSQGATKSRPDWDRELEYVLEGKGESIPVTVVCDLFAQDERTGNTYAFELKSPLPNSDITKVSKEKVLKLYSMEPFQVNHAYFALPYNPYGRREDYEWSFPDRWFNMKADPVVLIGDEFWDKVGGPGTYQTFIEAVNEIGPQYRERVYREFLGIEPPDTGIPTLR